MHLVSYSMLCVDTMSRHSMHCVYRARPSRKPEHKLGMVLISMHRSAYEGDSRVCAQTAAVHARPRRAPERAPAHARPSHFPPHCWPPCTGTTQPRQPCMSCGAVQGASREKMARA